MEGQPVDEKKATVNGNWGLSFAVTLLAALGTIKFGSLKLSGRTRERISKITILDEDEKTEFIELWDELSVRAYPYEKWFKVFPTEAWDFFRYNQKICQECIDAHQVFGN